MECLFNKLIDLKFGDDLGQLHTNVTNQEEIASTIRKLGAEAAWKWIFHTLKKKESVDWPINC